MLSFLLDNLFTRFGLGCVGRWWLFLCAGCATLVADFFLFCYSGGRGVVPSLSDDEQAGVVDAFGT